MNNIIHCALIYAGMPVRLEPPGLLCSDGKRPDGVSMVPWRSEKFVMCNATCLGIFAPFCSNLAVQAAGADAGKAESLKEEKHPDLPTYINLPHLLLSLLVSLARSH